MTVTLMRRTSASAQPLRRCSTSSLAAKKAAQALAPADQEEKRVRFSAELDFSSKPAHSIPEDKSGLWWSADELEESKYEQRVFLKRFQKSHADFTRNYFGLYKDCANLSITQALRSSMGKTLIQTPELRGLEIRLSKMTITAYRQKYVNTLLDSTECMNEAMIRQRLQEISRPSRTMARLLAHSDMLHVQRDQQC